MSASTSDAFEEYRAQFVSEVAQGADPEDRDEYRAVNIFWTTQEARWSHPFELVVDRRKQRLV